ncbi:MAG: hypothetical protein JW860_08305 [Sedimentisphaerales bacterium]|nr:hypothetical protein [Sedimentisphaerales bacterium]
MSNSIELQEQINRLSRKEGRSLHAERSLVTAPGARPPAFAVRVISRESYNLYNVQMVEITAPGQHPAPVAGELEAYNLAESFTEQGTVTSGTYAVMWCCGNCNVFYVKA